MRPAHFIVTPHPKLMDVKSGLFQLKDNGHIFVPQEDRDGLFPVARTLQKVIADQLKLQLPIVVGKRGALMYDIIFEKAVQLPEQSYILEIGLEGVRISYGNAATAFHAVSTLKQLLLQSGGTDLPCLTIEDWPDFAARGIMLDICKNKVPNLNALYKLVDLMADLKMNQLQLYLDNFSFAYPSYPDTWMNRTPAITGEEIILLDRYCRERFIDLVPNQNSFGHLTAWLKREEFKHLAESENGFKFPYGDTHWGWCDDPFSLNPLDSESLKLVESMYDDLLPNFSSGMLNVGCDETMDLGQGKSKEACERLGKGWVYFDFLMKVHELAKSRDKRMMFWGDIIIQYPELIPELPKDIIALEWAYNVDEPSAEHCEQFMKSGIPYYVCPGTSSWNSIFGLTDVMKSNLENAANRGKQYGAIGYLITEWGDVGAWQSLTASYAGFCYGAALSWGVEQNKAMDIGSYLSRSVFHDRNEVMGRLCLDLGNYFRHEQRTVYNGSGIFRTLYFDQLTDENTELQFLNLPVMEQVEFASVKKYVNGLLEELDKAEMRCTDADILMAEIRNTIKLVLHGANLGLLKRGSRESGERGSRLETMIEDLDGIMENYRRIWEQRNIKGGADDSFKRLTALRSQYEAALSSARNVQS